MSVLRVCDIGFADRASPGEVLRFTLRRKNARVSVKAGGIDLCPDHVNDILVPRMQRNNPAWYEGGSLTCDVCKDTRPTTVRYTAKRTVREDGVVKHVSSGGIQMCDPCWVRIAKPKMRGAR